MPLGHSVNANLVCLAGMSVHPDHDEAMRRGVDGFRFFGYSLAHHAIFGMHPPGVTNVWERYEAVREQMPPTPGEAAIRTPAQVLANLQGYADAGVDQMIFIQQCGKNRHDHICEATAPSRPPTCRRSSPSAASCKWSRASTTPMPAVSMPTARAVARSRYRRSIRRC